MKSPRRKSPCGCKKVHRRSPRRSPPRRNSVRDYWNRVHRSQSPSACSGQRGRQTTSKYRNRPSPPYPANQCIGVTKMGNDGYMYISRKNVNGIGTWQRKAR